MKALSGAMILVLVAVVTACGSSDSAPTGGPATAAQVAALEAANSYQRAFLARDPEAACDLLTGEAKRGLAEELEISTDCETSFETAFELFGPDDDAKLREAIRSTDAADVSVDGDEATFPLPDGRALHMQEVEGRWYVAETSTGD